MSNAKPMRYTVHCIYTVPARNQRKYESLVIRDVDNKLVKSFSTKDWIDIIRMKLWFWIRGIKGHWATINYANYIGWYRKHGAKRELLKKLHIL